MSLVCPDCGTRKQRESRRCHPCAVIAGRGPLMESRYWPTATPAEESPKGSAATPPICACCALGLFMPHGVGHVSATAKSVAA